MVVVKVAAECQKISVSAGGILPSPPLPSNDQKTLYPRILSKNPERSQISSTTTVFGFCSHLLLFCDPSKFHQKNLKTKKRIPVPNDLQPINPPAGDRKKSKNQKSKAYFPLPSDFRISWKTEFLRRSDRASLPSRKKLGRA
jgi:hypothetical protein